MEELDEDYAGEDGGPARAPGARRGAAREFSFAFRVHGRGKRTKRRR
jgi:hypothetical protein